MLLALTLTTLTLTPTLVLVLAPVPVLVLASVLMLMLMPTVVFISLTLPECSVLALRPGRWLVIGVRHLRCPDTPERIRRDVVTPLEG